MGIRFACHGCHKPLNIKNELAGRRGVCPQCQTRFRIPHEDAEYSTPVGQQVENAASERRVDAATQSGATIDSGDGSSGGLATLTQTAVSSTGSVEILDSDPDATWYVRPPSGGQYGPAGGEVLKSWIDEGRVARDALLWRDGWPQWRDAAEVLSDIADTLPGGDRSRETFRIGEPEAHPKPNNISIESPVSASIEPAQAVGVQSVQTQSVAAQRESRSRGSSAIGAVRRERTSKRITTVAILGAVVIGLLVALVIVATRGN